MLKKLLTGCLTIVAAAALAVPAMAADISGKVNGRAIGELVSSSDKAGKADAVSKMDMGGRARFGYDLTAKEGDWKVTGTLETYSNFSVAYGDAALTLHQKFVKLENDAFSVALGTQWWGMCYKAATGAWTTGETIDRFCYGVGGSINTVKGALHNFGTAMAAEVPLVNSQKSRDERMIIGVKSIGLQVMLEMNYDGGATATGDEYNSTAYGVQYDGAFGPVGLTAAYVSKGTAANGKASEKTPKDAATFTAMTLGVQYNLNEAMALEFDYEAETYAPGYTSKGATGAKTQTGTTMGLAFSMALSETQGILVGYDTSVFQTGETGAKDVNYASLTIDFIQKIAGQKFYAGYKTESTTSDVLKDLNANFEGGIQTSKLLVGAKVMF